jgi:hypothetical protein
MRTTCAFVGFLLPVFMSCGTTSTPGYQTTSTSPTIGWEAFEASIRYPELMLRMGDEGYVSACFVVDSVGNADSITIYSRACGSSYYNSYKDTIWNAGEPFLREVVKSIRSTTWTRPPGLQSPGDRWQTIDFLFLTKPNGRNRRVIIEKERPVIDVAQ